MTEDKAIPDKNCFESKSDYTHSKSENDLISFKDVDRYISRINVPSEKEILLWIEKNNLTEPQVELISKFLKDLNIHPW